MLSDNTKKTLGLSTTWFRTLFKGANLLTFWGQIIFIRFAVPRIVQPYIDAGVALPKATQILSGQGQYWYVFLIFAIIYSLALFVVPIFNKLPMLFVAFGLQAAWVAMNVIAVFLLYLSVASQITDI